MTGAPALTAARDGALAALPGLALVAAGVLAATALHQLLSALALLTAAVLLGVVVGNLWALRGGVPTRCADGVSLAARQLLRLGIVLLGLRLALGDLADLGAVGLLVVVGVVAATFAGTWWLARRFGLAEGSGVLLGAGYAICGVSAIAAVSATTRARQEDVAAAVAMVTLCGSLSIVVLPLAGTALSLEPAAFGTWVGASVHDVGQVVAAASTAGPIALDHAVVVKLTRVVILAPLVAALALAARRQATVAGGTDGGRPGTAAGRPPLVPLFVACFLAAVALRTTGWLPVAALEWADQLQQVLLAAALFALGLGVRLDRLVRTGGGVLAVGLLAWGLVAGVSLAALRWLA